MTVHVDKKRLILMGLLWGMGSAGGAVRAGTINVPGDQPTIQAAIDAAVSGADEVVVAPGTYNEVIDFSGKAITVRSSGGAGVTIIDGTGLNDAVVKCVSGEGSDTVLEGFTITGGTGAVDIDGDISGGGMYNEGSGPTVTDCIFRGNTADFGGGMNNAFSQPVVTGCTFSENTAGEGGGMHNWAGSTPTVTYCAFTNNVAAGGGGGMINHESRPRVTHCTFIRNTAQGDSSGGGAIYNISAPRFTRIINCVFRDNGAVRGGGMCSIDNSELAVTYCTFAGNRAEVSGGADWSSGNSYLEMVNCIVWNNGGTPFGGTGGLTIAHNNIQFIEKLVGPLEPGTSFFFNIEADPLFVDPVNGDLRLSPGSPCIDVGLTGTLLEPATDLDGNPRVSNGVVDMGAYEFTARDTSIDTEGKVGGGICGAGVPMFAASSLAGLIGLQSRRRRLFC